MDSSIPELRRRRALYAGSLKIAIQENIPDLIVNLTNRLLAIDEQLNPSKDEPMTSKRRLLESKLKRQRRGLRNACFMGGIEDMQAAHACINETEEEIRNLRNMTPFDTQGESK